MAINARKVYVSGYIEAWIGMKLSTDAELMYSAIGMAGDPANWPNDESRQSWTQDIIRICQDSLAPCFGADWTLQGGFCLFGVYTGGDPVLPPAKFDAVLGPIVGIRGPGGSAPQNTAVLVHKTVPSGRTGRMYLPGVNEGNVAPNGAIDGTELAIWQGALTNLKDGLLDFPEITQLAMLASVAGDAHTAIKGVTSLVVDGVVATQRRRLRR